MVQPTTMKRTNYKNCFLPLLIIINLAIIPQANAVDLSEGDSGRSSSIRLNLTSFKERMKSKFKKIFKKRAPNLAVSSQGGPVGVAAVNTVGTPSEVSSNSVLVDSRTSLTPVRITVSELFGEIAIDHDDFQGWKPAGQGLGKLGVWTQSDNRAQSQHRQDKLIEIFRADYQVAVTLVNEIPVVLNEENRSFFENRDSEGVSTDPLVGFPFDGTWVATKYIFYPHTVVDSDEISDDDQPITFYLVKNISEITSELNLEKGNESLHLGEEFYHSAIIERAKGNIPASISWFEKSGENGNARANLLISQFYLEGNGVDRDHDKGMTYLNLAAARGNSEAQFQLGLRNYYTLPETQDSLSGAVTFLLKASSQGHLRAKFFLAGLYDRGKGIAKNSKEAKRLFAEVVRASADGSVLELRAQIRLDDLNDDCISLMKRQVQLHKLATMGLASAMAATAGLVFEGHLVLPAQIVQKFLNDAARLGNHEAIILLDQVNL